MEEFGRKTISRIARNVRVKHCSDVFDMPKTTEAQVLGKQMLRSGTSVGANYREHSRPQ